ncbi:MAG: hypothetical protein K6D02_04215 [Lachnospiraceae bacterium]|nr:hypothetical protein [Lachnospiraceae bacterium]
MILSLSFNLFESRKQVGNFSGEILVTAATNSTVKTYSKTLSPYASKTYNISTKETGQLLSISLNCEKEYISKLPLKLYSSAGVIQRQSTLSYTSGGACFKATYKLNNLDTYKLTVTNQNSESVYYKLTLTLSTANNNTKKTTSSKVDNKSKNSGNNSSKNKGKNSNNNSSKNNKNNTSNKKNNSSKKTSNKSIKNDTNNSSDTSSSKTVNNGVTAYSNGVNSHNFNGKNSDKNTDKNSQISDTNSSKKTDKNSGKNSGNKSAKNSDKNSDKNNKKNNEKNSTNSDNNYTSVKLKNSFIKLQKNEKLSFSDLMDNYNATSYEFFCLDITKLEINDTEIIALKEGLTSLILKDLDGNILDTCTVKILK